MSMAIRAKTAGQMNTDQACDAMFDLIARMNSAFYVDGSSKALKPIMAETKQLLIDARCAKRNALEGK